ncbi:MAG: MvaI/BcnI family restriction endonuclease [Candidatus Helarchaeota archaeon]
MKTYTKKTLIDALKEIRNMGWIPNARPGNAGGIGNTVEDLLGIEENNCSAGVFLDTFKG